MNNFLKRNAGVSDSDINTDLQKQLAELHILDHNDELQAIIEEKKHTNEMVKEYRKTIREFFARTKNTRAKLITMAPQVKNIIELIRTVEGMQSSPGKNVNMGEVVEAGTNMVITIWDSIVGDGSENGGKAYYDLLKILSIIYDKAPEDLEELPPTDLYLMAVTLFKNPKFAVFFQLSPQSGRRMPFGI